MLNDEKPVLVPVNPDDAEQCEICLEYRKRFLTGAKIFLYIIAAGFGFTLACITCRVMG